jgi:hypothetical protein
MEDEDDIEWPEDPFDRHHRAEPESPDELLAMIQFEGTPALQQALRALCREFIDIFSTAVRPLPAKVMSMVIDIDRSKWELPCNRLPQLRNKQLFAAKWKHLRSLVSSRNHERLIGARSTQSLNPRGSGDVTSQHVLYYCTYYSVSFACTAHCTYYIYCTLYIQYMFPVSQFPMFNICSHSCSHL